MYFLQGGDGLQHVATHNPLYITDHRDGGYGLKTDYEKERETIYAGVYDGQAVGVGTICEFVSKEGADKADQSSTFQVRFFFKVTNYLFGGSHIGIVLSILILNKKFQSQIITNQKNH